jgi:hypothetical protein
MRSTDKNAPRSTDKNAPHARQLFLTGKRQENAAAAASPATGRPQSCASQQQPEQLARTFLLLVTLWLLLARRLRLAIRLLLLLLARRLRLAIRLLLLLLARRLRLAIRLLLLLLALGLPLLLGF